MTSDGLKFSKPHPEIYLKALRKAGCGASEVLVFEDSSQGITSALAAGLRVVSFKSGVQKAGNDKCDFPVVAHFSHWKDIAHWFLPSLDAHAH